MKARVMALVLELVCGVTMKAQQSPGTPTNTLVPPLVNFAGILADSHGGPLTEAAAVTFRLYQDPQGGTPLWTETQTVQADQSGHYWVMLGAATSTGLPPSLFAAGEAKWLSVEVQ